MFNTNYKIEAIENLLNEDCILKRYYSLIPYKSTLVEKLKKVGCQTKADCLALSDKSILHLGLPDMEMVNLFKCFLGMYDIKPQKLKEIDTIGGTPEEIVTFKELYQLPGVKSTRATLYYKAGFQSLESIAVSTSDEIIAKTEDVIKREELDLKVPLMKEVKTHIAVAKAFTNNL